VLLEPLAGDWASFGADAARSVSWSARDIARCEHERVDETAILLPVGIGRTCTDLNGGARPVSFDHVLFAGVSYIGSKEGCER
jgi:hypothetical protein